MRVVPGCSSRFNVFGKDQSVSGVRGSVMLLGAHAFVTIIYGTMALSFVATTAVLAWEFQAEHRWIDFMAMDSHLFLFFPTFGVLALLAFYLPSVAFVDHYWRHVPLGKVRFLLGLVVLVAASHYFAQMILSGQNRSMWEVRPVVLEEDEAKLSDCAEAGVQPGNACERVPLLTAINSLRRLSQQRIGVSEFERNCQPDPLLEPLPEDTRLRYCVATTPFPEQLKTSPIERFSSPTGVVTRGDVSTIQLVDDATCCQAQEQLVSAINRYYSNSENRSVTGVVHAATLPLKVFFLMILLAISFLLTLRFEGIASNYPTKLTRIEAGVIVGTIAALFFPLMSQAFLQSLSVIVGDSGTGAFSAMVPVMSLLFGAWTLLIVLFFFRRNGDNVELLTKLASAAAGGIALFKYDVIVSTLVRIVGSGASWVFLAVLVAMAVLMAFVLLRILVGEPVPDQTNPSADATKVAAE